MQILFMFYTDYIEVWYTIHGFVVPDFNRAQCLNFLAEERDAELMAAIANAPGRREPIREELESADWRLGEAGQTLKLGGIELLPYPRVTEPCFMQVSLPRELERFRGGHHVLPLREAIEEAERIHEAVKNV